MDLILEQPDYEYYLRSANGTSALVNDESLYQSFIISPEQLIKDWPPRTIQQLHTEHLEQVFALNPEVILLGTGADQVFPDPQILAASLSRGIGLEAMTNAAAARTFNVLASEGRRVTAAFLLDPK